MSLTVHGGAGGVHARFEDLATLGRVYADLGDDLGRRAVRDRGEALDGDLVASAPLAPRTFAAAEAAILGATYGPHGLVARALSVQAQSLTFDAVADLYVAADLARERAAETLSWGLGFVIGLHLPQIAIVGGTLGAPLLGPIVLDPRLADRLGERTITTIEDNPWMAEGLVGGGGGLLDGLGLNPLTGPIVHFAGIDRFHAGTEDAAADLGELLFGRYRGELDPGYDGPRFTHRPPEGLADLIGSLRDTADRDVPDGVFTVQRITLADGTDRWIVQLPGTDSFTEERVVRGMGGNLGLIGGESTAYGEAVRAAMREAGIGPRDPVLLVGHSQGGMQAVALAADGRLGFRVTDVVTVGSPVATTDVPRGVHVLSIENTGDLVPLLDGEQNPDRPNRTTLLADVHTGHLGAEDGQNHSLSVYQDIAGEADRSEDPRVRTGVDRLREGGFVGGEGARSRTETYRAEVGDQVREARIR